jgi:phytoene dehydrogenase-like protein
VFDDIGWSLVSEDEMDCEVLVIGAGPTGLVLALWLTKLGVKVRIVDKTAEAGTTSRALAIQARTLELYRHQVLGTHSGHYFQNSSPQPVREPASN